jgi:protein TonB
MFLRKSAAQAFSFVAHTLALGTSGALALGAHNGLPSMGPPGPLGPNPLAWIRIEAPPSPLPPGSAKTQPGGFETELEPPIEEEDGFSVSAYPVTNIGGQDVGPAGVRGVIGGVEGGIIGGVVGGLVGGLASIDGLSPPGAGSLLPSTPLRAGRGVSIPTKLVDVAPRYPPLARQARIEGVVVLDATIDEGGWVVDVRVLRSITALDRAAVEAVQQWRYAPAIQNGLPVRVLLTVTVAFSLPR